MKHPSVGGRAVDVALYWNSRHRHNTMGCVVARECSKGVATGEDGVLAGVPGILLHQVHSRVLGHTIHRAGFWAWEGRLEPHSRPVHSRVRFWDNDGVRLRGCKEMEDAGKFLGDYVRGLLLPSEHCRLPLVHRDGVFLLKSEQGLGHPGNEVEIFLGALARVGDLGWDGGHDGGLFTRQE